MSLKDDLNIENDKNIPANYQISYFVHQDDMNKLDMSHKRVEKWLFVLCIAMFIALVGTNAYWIWNESQYEDISTTVTQETSSEGGGDAIINGEHAGVVYYGESKANSDYQNP